MVNRKKISLFLILRYLIVASGAVAVHGGPAHRVRTDAAAEVIGRDTCPG